MGRGQGEGALCDEASILNGVRLGIVESTNDKLLHEVEGHDTVGMRYMKLANRCKITMPFVYILRCADNSYYTGQTTDIERRLEEHQSGIYEGYTHSRRPVTLLWFQEAQTDNDAFLLGRKLKGWSRAKKEALIHGDFNGVHEVIKAEHGRRK
jgi:putative endonuclease